MLNIKTFPVRMTEDFNKELRIVAAKAGTSMHDYVIEAIKEKIEKENKKGVQ